MKISGLGMCQKWSQDVQNQKFSWGVPPDPPRLWFTLDVHVSAALLEMSVFYILPTEGNFLGGGGATPWWENTAWSPTLNWESVLGSCTVQSYLDVASSPGPFPAFQCCTLKARFSTCNIEKLGMGLGTRLIWIHYILTQLSLVCGSQFVYNTAHTTSSC